MFRARRVACFLLLIPALFLDIGIAAAMDTDQAVAVIADRLTSRQHGVVARVKGDTIYIAVGDDDGILDGSQFDIVRLGEPIEVDGEVIGHEERLVSKAIATHVRKKLTIAETVAALDAPRVGDRAYLARDPVTRIVVAPFTVNGAVSVLSQAIQEGLTTALLKDGVSVVERSQLDQLLAEQKLGYSGLIDLASAKRLGVLLGADSIILGTLRGLGDDVDVTARLVALGTGTGYRAAQVRIAKTQTVANQLGDIVDQSDRVVSREPPGVEKNGELPRWDNDEWRIEVLSAARADEAVLVRLRISNKTMNVGRLMPSRNEGAPYLIDPNGNVFTFKSFENLDHRGLSIAPEFSQVVGMQFRSNDKGGDQMSMAAFLKMSRDGSCCHDTAVTIKSLQLSHTR